MQPPTRSHTLLLRATGDAWGEPASDEVKADCSTAHLLKSVKSYARKQGKWLFLINFPLPQTTKASREVKRVWEAAELCSLVAHCFSLMKINDSLLSVSPVVGLLG